MEERTQRSDGARTREKILEVALPLFAAKGFAGTSVRAIATAAEVNVATLAYHFGGKQGLYDAVVVRLHEDLELDFPSELVASTPPDRLIRAVVERAWSFVKNHREHIQLQVRHVLDTGAQPEVVVRERSEPLLVRAEGLVGMFRPDWGRVERRMLVLALMHTTVRLSLEDRGQLATMLGGVDDLDEAVVAFLEGLVKRELGLL